MFNNFKGKKKREKWKWRNKVTEEVESFKYLEFTFNRNGNYKEHIKELKGKGRLYSDE